MIKTLIINYEFPPFGGGAGRATKEIASRLGQYEIEPVLLVGVGKTANADICQNVKIIQIRIPRKSLHQTGSTGMLWFWLSAGLNLRKIITAEKPDLIHYFFSVPTGLLSLLPGHHRPYIVSLRGGDIPGYNPGEMQIAHYLMRPFNRRIIRRASAVVALSRDLAMHANKLLPDCRIEIIPNGVDTSLFKPATKTPRSQTQGLRLITVCRLVEWKGIQHLLATISSLRDCVASLKIIGTGPFMSKLQEITASNGINDIVDFAGYIPHEKLTDHYNNADVFVMPSFGDSFGQTFTEAMACGLPIIAAHHGGVTDFVEDNINGLLVPPHDSEAINRAIRKLKSELLLQDQMRTANIAKTRDKLGWNNIARSYGDIYRQVLKREP